MIRKFKLDGFDYTAYLDEQGKVEYIQNEFGTRFSAYRYNTKSAPDTWIRVNHWYTVDYLIRLIKEEKAKLIEIK